MLYNNGGNKQLPLSATPHSPAAYTGHTHIKTINFAVIYLNLNVATMHAAGCWRCLLPAPLFK